MAKLGRCGARAIVVRAFVIMVRWNRCRSLAASALSFRRGRGQDAYICKEVGILRLVPRAIVSPAQRLGYSIHFFLPPPKRGTFPSTPPCLSEGVSPGMFLFIKTHTLHRARYRERLHPSKTAASSLLAAGKFEDDRRCPYVSTVVVIVECPSMACTYLTDSLFVRRSEAYVWRRS